MNRETGQQKLQITNHLEHSYEDDINTEVLHGLKSNKKWLPCKYFYDSKGSKLFDKICSLPEYYLTRTESSLLQQIAPEILDINDKVDIVELGSGSNKKIKILLDEIKPENLGKVVYIPVDCSESALLEASNELIRLYPRLKVHGVIADFTKHLAGIPNENPLMILFLGSSIGNFESKEAIRFIRNISSIMKQDDRFFLAFDLIKPKEIIEAAYNDSQGIPSAFNKNIL